MYINLKSSGGSLNSVSTQTTLRVASIASGRSCLPFIFKSRMSSFFRALTCGRSRLIPRTMAGVPSASKSKQEVAKLKKKLQKGFAELAKPEQEKEEYQEVKVPFGEQEHDSRSSLAASGTMASVQDKASRTSKRSSALYASSCDKMKKRMAERQARESEASYAQFVSDDIDSTKVSSSQQTSAWVQAYLHPEHWGRSEQSLCLLESEPLLTAISKSESQEDSEKDTGEEEFLSMKKTEDRVQEHRYMPSSSGYIDSSVSGITSGGYTPVLKKPFFTEKGIKFTLSESEHDEMRGPFGEQAHQSATSLGTVPPIVLKKHVPKKFRPSSTNQPQNTDLQARESDIYARWGQFESVHEASGASTPLALDMGGPDKISVSSENTYESSLLSSRRENLHLGNVQEGFEVRSHIESDDDWQTEEEWEIIAGFAQKIKRAKKKKGERKKKKN